MKEPNAIADQEPNYTDGIHLRPIFVKDRVHCLDFLLA